MNKIERQDKLIIIHLDNGAENYLQNPDFVNQKDLRKAVEEEETKAIIIRGTGRHFSAGADLEEIKKRLKSGDLEASLEKGKMLFSYIKSLNIPLISAVEGVCFGAGFEIVLHSDIRIAGRKALFAFPEVNHNLMPGLGGTRLLPKTAGTAKALEILLKGDLIDAEAAQKWKLIDHICEPKQSFEQALQLARKMTSGRPLYVIQAITQAVRNAAEKSYEEALEEETLLFSHLARKAYWND